MNLSDSGKGRKHLGKGKGLPVIYHAETEGGVDVLALLILHLSPVTSPPRTFEKKSKRKTRIIVFKNFPIFPFPQN